MKNILKIALTTILAFQATTALAGTISQSGKWFALTENKHYGWQEPSCRAATANHKNRAILEVYSEKRNGKYGEPTVQITTTKGYKDLYRVNLAIYVKGKKYKSDMYAALRAGMNPDARMAIVQIPAREQVINLLKAGDKVEATFYGKTRGWIGKTTFSLKGSSATINNMMSTCGLKFNTIDL